MDVATAIRLINPDAQFVVENNNVSKITWVNTTPIPIEDIQAKDAESDAALKAEQDTWNAEVASATNKLKNLGLTEGEIRHFIVPTT